RSAERIRSRCLVRSQISFWCARAAILTASAMSPSAASSRIWCRRGRAPSPPAPPAEKAALFPPTPLVLLFPAARFRFTRVPPVPGRGQRLHPRPPVGLDHDHDLSRVRLAVLPPARGDQVVEPGEPVHALRQPPPGHRLACRVVHDHVMVTLGPVIADEQHS